MKLKYLFVLVIIGIISNAVAAESEKRADISDNGILNINLDNNSPLLYNVQSVQIAIVSVEYGKEKTISKFENKLPFSSSFSLNPGIYKVYIKKDDSTIIEYNDDSNGYILTPGSKVSIPGISTQYINAIFTDVLSDIPWRINPGKNIPISYMIKDADQFPLYIRTIKIYDDDEPIGDGANDILVYTHGLWQWFTGDLWYDHDDLSPSIFNETDNYLEIHVVFDITSAFDVHNFYTVHKSPNDLPKLGNWYYGDTHYHSFYTDNAYEFGAPLETTAVTGKAIGLDWAAATDHSFDLDPNRWRNLVSDSVIYSTNNFRIFPSEEISCTVLSPLYQEYNHYLAYNITEYIPGGEWEDGTGSDYNCSELVSIVNRQGGFGYPAHPMDDGIFIQPWQDYSLNFRGLEIWNGAGDTAKLEEGLKQWTKLLLKGRKIFVEAGSDAHGDFSSFGRVRTLVLASNFNNKEILSSLRNGHSIMTDGPLVVFSINNAIIGNTLKASKGANINLNIKWNSTQEFGKVGHIKIVKGVIGNNEIMEKEIHPNSYSGSNRITLKATRDVYYRLIANTSDGHRVYTNPIWINTPPESISGLKNITYKPNYINWTWKDPSDLDLAKVMIYINGMFKKNVPKGVRYYNATNLNANTLYEISTHTVDTSGNINKTWMNHTARTAR